MPHLQAIVMVNGVKFSLMKPDDTADVHKTPLALETQQGLDLRYLRHGYLEDDFIWNLGTV